MPTDLRSVTSIDSLLGYLEEELDWPINGYEKEEVTFTYSPAELGLKEDAAAAIKAIYQLRPLHPAQPWGIFFVEFERKKLPVVVLRSILSHLVIKKRASANKADRAAWNAEDLLFISAFGEGGTADSEIAFAHFHSELGDLPTLRVLGWDGGDTRLKLDHVALELKHKLHWPAKPSDAAAWRRQWAGAFRHRVGHVIRTADALATEMAALARAIRDAARTKLAAESNRGPLTRLFHAFREALIHDLKPEDFADTYAQTITYGLLTTALSRTPPDAGAMSRSEQTAFAADDIVSMVPITNPFLKEMLEEFLRIGGRKSGINFDELGIQSVVELLRGDETDLPAVIRDFGNRKPGEDPVIHFYEHFLSAYNKQLKIQRGVFYTPQPVVSYIVRSVHELLQTEFGLADGLADTTTWGEMLKKHPDLELPTTFDDKNNEVPISPDEPFVQILDPATGTATFLVEVIDVIHRHLEAKWKTNRAALPSISSFIPQPSSFGTYWNQYVPKHLLPRLHAFELMMAPYAIAHMKIGLKLAETGYRFGIEERARIYLTNALEPWVRQLPLIGFDALAHEADAVNEIKRHKRFTVVIGNPPYAGVSANHGEWITRLIDIYRFVDGQPLEYKKVWLKNDYVKFLRLAQLTVDTSGRGIVGMITDHSYLDSPTFRGMRNSLLKSFSDVRFLNLHGNSKRRENNPAGGVDENVFDITQGVAIGLFARTGAADNSASYADAWGSRQKKYDRFANSSATKTEWAPIIPKPGFYLFANLSASTPKEEYQAGWFITDVFVLGSNGVQTSRDSLVLAPSRKELTERFEWIRNSFVSDAEIQKTYKVEDKSFWQLEGARGALKADLNWTKRITGYAYRPFDNSWLYASPDFVHRLRREVMQHMEHANLALCVGRAGLVVEGSWNLVFATNTVCDHNFFYRGSSLNCPLYRYYEDELIAKAKPAGHNRSHNIGHRFSAELAQTLKLDFDQQENLPAGLTPEDIFHYAYAVFHSPGYRSRYAEFLKIDFPRLPLPRNIEFFRALAALGRELVALHLLESPKLDHPMTEFIGPSREVEKVGYTDGTVWIDASGSKATTRRGTSGFRGVPEAVWNFHIGGYQVCEKWLKDRKDRTLTDEDVAHYHKIVVALSETIRLMTEIDEVIESHGGWPGAFSTSNQSQQAK